MELSNEIYLLTANCLSKTPKRKLLLKLLKGTVKLQMPGVLNKFSSVDEHMHFAASASTSFTFDWDMQMSQSKGQWPTNRHLLLPDLNILNHSNIRATVPSVFLQMDPPMFGEKNFEEWI